ncbi:AraC family transcriptional regulator [Pseudonocardia spinosispora]|uniref:AraC family transcriptional regulator n=1 Tax=Pseudonocardia spinosispora TaxID=103441 RepID=UPI000559BFB4|nr:helix-turn-helix domain-containing protein [Pseudonocardia spinosispora]
MPHYQEFDAPTPLRALVECTWRGSLDVDEQPHRQRVLPDGCMDLIWSGSQLLVAGPDTAAFVTDQQPGQILTGLRFRPGAAPGLLGLPATELRDSRRPLADLHPLLARRVIASVEAGHSPEQALIGAVRDTLSPDGLPVPGLGQAVRLLTEGAGVASTADALGWTSRSLHRRAVDAFGYGPSTLRRILRFRAACRLAWRGVPAAEVAAVSGYADQAHLSREVRALAGVPLGQLLAETPSAANRSTVLPSGSRSTA